MSSSLHYRNAERSDAVALAELERACFNYDALSQRNFTWMLTKGNAHILVAEENGQLLAYVLVLYKRATSLARLYSLAVLPECQGRGIARELMQRAEHEARERDCIYMRLEVRPDNVPAIALYHKLGYYHFGLKHQYYDDSSDALCLEKVLSHGEEAVRLPVPHYAQTTGFTCGPACLLMALHALDDNIPLTQRLELQLWREATTIFMTAGHGGCGPHGLALAAHRRGFHVEMYVNQDKPLFVDGVRAAEKKAIIQRVEEDFTEQLQQTDVVLDSRPPNVDELVAALREGRIPVVLISSFHLTRMKAPHWVILTGFDEDFIYFHDPEVDADNHETAANNAYVPMRKDDFARIARFGRSQLRAMLILSRREILTHV